MVSRFNALHTACEALRQWPRGLIDVRLAPGSADGTREWLRSLWSRLGKAESTKAPAKVKSRPVPRKAVLKRSREDDPVGIRRATELAQLSPQVLHAAWEHRLVTQHERAHGERIVPTFDQAELLALGAAWRRRRQPDSVAFEFGLPLYAIEQLASVGCIKADAPSIPGTGPHFTPESVSAFEAKLKAGTRDLLDPIALRQAMRLVGGRLKPWGPALRLLLDGSVPYELIAGRRLADRIIIERKHAEAVVSLVFDARNPPVFGFSGTMAQGDALEVLNAGGDLAHVLQSVPSTGRNPKFYLMTDVLSRARQVVTLPEIAAVRGTDPATALQELSRQKLICSKVAPGVWPRRLLKRQR